MSTEANMATARQMIERAFNAGDLDAVDELLSPTAVDHQEAEGSNFPAHLKQAIRMLRTAFPDLHFDIHHMLAEDDIVAFHSTMTGTHLGTFREIPATGCSIRVRHMHFVRLHEGLGTELWHLWDTPALMRQLNTAAKQAVHPT